MASLQIHVPPTILSSYQVVVSGGGCAGLTAAIAAARTGAKVLLIEKAAFSGGVITNVGLSYFDGMADATTDRIILGGLPLEFLHRMEICGMGATHLDEVDPARAVYKAGAITIRNTEEFKVLADRMIAECSPNLDVLYHTTVCAAETVDGQITSLVVANKSGLVRIEAPVFIDATGDADVARFAGGRVAISESLMPMTLHFRVGDVENSENLRQAVRREVLAAHESGELELFYGPHFGYLFGKNEITVHAVRVRGNGGDPWERSRAEQRARADAWAMFDRWKRNIPEFADAYFLFSGPETGVRESFRIEGMETLTEDDILGQRSYDDGVATGTWYMDLHPNETTIDVGKFRAGEVAGSLRHSLRNFGLRESDEFIGGGPMPFRDPQCGELFPSDGYGDVHGPSRRSGSGSLPRKRLCSTRARWCESERSVSNRSTCAVPSERIMKADRGHRLQTQD